MSGDRIHDPPVGDQYISNPLLEWWEEETLSKMLKVKRPTMAAWRRRGVAPPWMRLGRKVYYRRSGVVQWLRDRAVSNEAASPVDVVRAEES